MMSCFKCGVMGNTFNKECFLQKQLNDFLQKYGKTPIDFLKTEY